MTMSLSPRRRQVGLVASNRRAASRFCASSPDDSIDMLLIMPRDGAAESSCPRGHRLAPYDTPQDGFACDRCKTRFEAGVKMLGCRQCDWDLCPSCCSKVPLVELVDR